jgi:hypothetical protein
MSGSKLRTSEQASPQQPERLAAFERDFFDYATRSRRGTTEGPAEYPYEYLLVIARRRGGELPCERGPAHSRAGTAVSLRPPAAQSGPAPALTTESLSTAAAGNLAESSSSQSAASPARAQTSTVGPEPEIVAPTAPEGSSFLIGP